MLVVNSVERIEVKRWDAQEVMRNNDMSLYRQATLLEIYFA